MCWKGKAYNRYKEKKLNEQELLHFRSYFNIPISDEDCIKAPFYKPLESSEEITYLKEIGIKTAFSMNPAHLSKNAKLHELPRIACEASYNSALIITKSFFIKFWNGTYNVLKGQSLQSLQRKKIRSYLKSINYY